MVQTSDGVQSSHGVHTSGGVQSSHGVDTSDGVPTSGGVQTSNAAQTSDGAHPAVSNRARGNLILAAMTASTFLFVLTEGLPNGLLTYMAPDLQASTSQIGLLVTGYALVVFSMSVPLAYATKWVPRRWALSVVIAVATIATLLVGFAHSYPWVLTGRLITGLAQAMFWIAVLPGTTGLFPRPVRGRVMARLALGNALAPVIGLPAVTWIAQHASWRAGFWTVSALGVLVWVLVTWLFPSATPGQTARQPAPFPNGRRFTLIQVQTVLVVAGAFGMITFLTQLLTEVTGFAQADLSVLLMVNGVGTVTGALIVARFLDPHPWGSLVFSAVVLIGALVALAGFATHQVLAVAMVVLFGMGFSGTAPIFSHRALLCSPLGTDVGQAIQSGTFNLGIAGGSAFGAALTAAVGVRAVPAVGAGLVAAGLVVAVIERRWCGRSPEP